MQGLIITETAAKEIKRVMKDGEIEDKILRVAVAGGGCSGFQYSLDFEDKKESYEDELMETQHEIDVVIDKKSLLFLDGTTLDYLNKDLNNRGFIFNNPNATGGCGCGNSFSC
jgi:iron-sulfur cluster assembly protein